MITRHNEILTYAKAMLKIRIMFIIEIQEDYSEIEQYFKDWKQYNPDSGGPNVT